MALGKIFGLSYSVLLIILGVLTILSALTNMVGWIWILALLTGIVQVVFGALSFIGILKFALGFLISRTFRFSCIVTLILNAMLLGVALTFEGNWLFPLIASVISLSLLLSSEKAKEAGATAVTGGAGVLAPA